MAPRRPMTARYSPRSCSCRPSGCAWRQLPPAFGVSVPTAHPRFCTWAAAGFFDRLHREVLDRLGGGGELDWSAAIVDSASVRAARGSLTGRNPVDRRKYGSKIHRLSDANANPAGHHGHRCRYSRQPHAAPTFTRGPVEVMPSICSPSGYGNKTVSGPESEHRRHDRPSSTRGQPRPGRSRKSCRIQFSLLRLWSRRKLVVSSAVRLAGVEAEAVARRAAGSATAASPAPSGFSLPTDGSGALREALVDGSNSTWIGHGADGAIVCYLTVRLGVRVRTACFSDGEFTGHPRSVNDPLQKSAVQSDRRRRSLRSGHRRTRRVIRSSAPCPRRCEAARPR